MGSHPAVRRLLVQPPTRDAVRPAFVPDGLPEGSLPDRVYGRGADRRGRQIEEVAKSVAECGRLGVAVLPADVNASDMGFTIEPLGEPLPAGISNRLGVRFGLSAIRNVGEGPISAILKARKQGGPFSSLEDFCDRVDRTALNKRVLESLIKSGAMDGLPGTRRQKLAILDQALAAGIEAQRAREAGQSSMFDLLGGGGGAAGISVQAIPLPIIEETPQDYKEQLAWEKELLGMYVSDHPIAKALEVLDLNDITPLSQIGEEQVGQTLMFAGMILQMRRLATKKGDSMLVAMLEDLEFDNRARRVPQELREVSRPAERRHAPARQRQGGQEPARREPSAAAGERRGA